MGRKGKNRDKYFYVAKGVKSDSKLTPLKGSPNTNIDKYTKKEGQFVSRRKIDNNGNAYVDLDVGHKGFDDHVHYIDITKTPPRAMKHSKPTKKQAKEIKKAKKKRKFWQ